VVLVIVWVIQCVVENIIVGLRCIVCAMLPETVSLLVPALA
jgi:hypothetical protein